MHTLKLTYEQMTCVLLEPMEANNVETAFSQHEDIESRHNITEYDGIPLDHILDVLAESYFEMHKAWPEFNDNIRLWEIIFEDTAFTSISIGWYLHNEGGVSAYKIFDVDYEEYVHRYIDEIINKMKPMLKYRKLINAVDGDNPEIILGLILDNAREVHDFHSLSYQMSEQAEEIVEMCHEECDLEWDEDGDYETYIKLSDEQVNADIKKKAAMFNKEFREHAKRLGFRYPNRAVLKDPTVVIYTSIGENDISLYELFNVRQTDEQEMSDGIIRFEGDGFIGFDVKYNKAKNTYINTLTVSEMLPIDRADEDFYNRSVDIVEASMVLGVKPFLPPDHTGMSYVIKLNNHHIGWLFALIDPAADDEDDDEILCEIHPIIKRECDSWFVSAQARIFSAIKSDSNSPYPHTDIVWGNNEEMLLLVLSCMHNMGDRMEAVFETNNPYDGDLAEKLHNNADYIGQIVGAYIDMYSCSIGRAISIVVEDDVRPIINFGIVNNESPEKVAEHIHQLNERYLDSADYYTNIK